MISESLIGEAVVEFKTDEAGQSTEEISGIYLIIGMKLSPEGEMLILMNAWTDDREIMLDDVIDGERFMLRAPAVRRMFKNCVPAIDLEEVKEAENDGESDDREE